MPNERMAPYYLPVGCREIRNNIALRVAVGILCRFCVCECVGNLIYGVRENSLSRGTWNNSLTLPFLCITWSYLAKFVLV